jgi:hypothetical protein
VGAEEGCSGNTLDYTWDAITVFVACGNKCVQKAPFQICIKKEFKDVPE